MKRRGNDERTNKAAWKNKTSGKQGHTVVYTIRGRESRPQAWGRTTTGPEAYKRRWDNFIEQ